MGNKTILTEETFLEKGWFSEKEDLNRMGFVIAYERNVAKLSSRVVCEGICHGSTMRRLEQGAIGCDKVVVDALLERIGVAPSRFQFFLKLQEEEFLQTRDRLIEAIRLEQWNIAEEYQKQYQEQTRGKNKLYRQFSLLTEVMAEWKRRGRTEKEMTEAAQNLRQKWIERLQEAWDITRKEYPLSEPLPARLTFQEIFLKSLYLRIQEERGQKEEAQNGYEELLCYLTKQTDPRCRQTLYPQIVWRLLKLYQTSEQNTSEYKAALVQERKAAQIWESCIDLLRQQGDFCYLPELIEYETERLNREYEGKFSKGKLPPRVQAQVSEWEKLCQSIRWLYEVHKEPYPEWDSVFSARMEEVYRIRDIISGRRKGYGLKPEELAEGICDEKEIRRIEQKEVDPQRETFQKLAAKLRFPSGSGTLVSQVGTPELSHVMWEISERTQFGNYEGVEERLELLRQKKGNSRYAEQNLRFLEETMKYSLEKIGPEEHQKELWKALHMTMPEKSPEQLKEWGFIRQEAMILNILAHSYDKLEKQEEGIAWIELLREYYEHQPFGILHYMDNYERALQELGNMYGNIREYEKAMELEKTVIQLALRSCRGDILRVVLYDYGWNMEHLWGKKDYTKEKSRLYIEAALELARFYKVQRSINHIEQHLKKIYG